MGYRHIDNLYKNKEILLFLECYALEKIDGTSANISYKNGEVTFFSGGAKYENFIELFDPDKLKSQFRGVGQSEVTIFGEAYGGKIQGLSHRYGNKLKFVAFELKFGENCWLDVPVAENIITKSFNLEFVHYVRTATDISLLDKLRDAPSEQAKRNGIIEPKNSEGIILRPLIECYTKNNRVIAKHKREEDRETKTIRRVIDADKQKILTQANEIAEEWVTEKRLEHVIDKIPNLTGIEDMKTIIVSMIEDVNREGEGEFLRSKDVDKAIGSRTAVLFKKYLHSKIKEK